MIGGGKTYEIQKDVEAFLKQKPPLDINYKTELLTAYTPVFTFHEEGQNAGLIDKTQYFRGYVDEQNQGQLVLEVREVYTIDDSDETLPYSAWPALSRTKTWVHVLQFDGSFDENNTKVKQKLYNTRQKRHIEGNRRRHNIEEQLIDRVGLAGVLSGAFSDEDDAFNKLTDLQTLHSAAFNSWMNSGRGSLYDDIKNDLTTLWLDTVVPNDAQTQALCPWMIGIKFRDYIQDKLKGNIK